MTDMLDTYHDTLLAYYEEEIMGEAYFRGLSRHFNGDGEREKLALLANVERHAAEAVRPLLEKHGLMPRDEGALHSLGAKDVTSHQQLDWLGLMAYMIDRYPGYVDDFEKLERMAPEDDLSPLKFLTKHEIVTIEFAEKEVEGAPDSVAPLRRYLDEAPI